MTVPSSFFACLVLFVYLFVCLFVYLFVCLFICLFVCLFVLVHSLFVVERGNGLGTRLCHITTQKHLHIVPHPAERQFEMLQTADPLQK